MSRVRFTALFPFVWILSLGSPDLLVAQAVVAEEGAVVAEEGSAADRHARDLGVKETQSGVAPNLGPVALVYGTATQPTTRPAARLDDSEPAGSTLGVIASLSNARERTGLAIPAMRLTATAPAPDPAAASGGGGAKAGHPARRSPSATLPWVGTVEWDVPEAYGSDAFKGSQSTLEPWAFFEEELDKSRVLALPPAYANVTPLPLFNVTTPNEGDFERGLKKLIRAKAYREIRHRLKREWRSSFVNDCSMSYAEYERRLFMINNIGKDDSERDDFNAQYEVTEVKQSFFRRSRVDGESDIPLISWGPFTLQDTGSLRFDVGTAAHSDAETQVLALGEVKRKPLLDNKRYRFDTSFNFDVDPFVAASQGDVRAAVRRCGISLDIDWLSDVLHREIVSTQIDLETDFYGDFKGFFNIVIKAR